MYVSSTCGDSIPRRVLTSRLTGLMGKVAGSIHVSVYTTVTAFHLAKLCARVGYQASKRNVSIQMSRLDNHLRIDMLMTVFSVDEMVATAARSLVAASNHIVARPKL